jgi:hypothetical protein
MEMKKMTAMQCKGFQPSIIPNPCPPKSSHSRSPVRHALHERPCFLLHRFNGLGFPMEGYPLLDGKLIVGKYLAYGNAVGGFVMTKE